MGRKFQNVAWQELFRMLIGGDLGGQKFDRDFPAKLLVLCKVFTRTTPKGGLTNPSP